MLLVFPPLWCLTARHSPCYTVGLLKVTAETTELSLLSRIDTVASAATAVAEFLTRSGISEDAAFGIDMAVREAVTNAVVHGNRQDENKAVDVTLKSSPDAVEISVRMIRAQVSIRKKSQIRPKQKTS